MFGKRFKSNGGLRRALAAGVLALLLPLVLAACGADPTPTPTSPPLAPTSTPVPAATTAPEPGVTAAPANTPTPDAMMQFKDDWDALIAKAQEEGELSLVLAGNTSRALRTAVIPLFEEKFGISVTSQGGTGSENANRMMAEREANIFSVDAWVTGTTTPTSLLIPNNMLVPVMPLLIHPDVLDTSNWFQDRLWLSDPSLTYTLGYSANGGRNSAFAWNTEEVSEDDLTSVQSYWDFVEDPRWKGRLASAEPWGTGQGNSAAWVYLEVGPDYWHRLLREQDLVVYSDQRQAAEAVALGKQHICLLGCGRVVNALTSEGLPIERYFPHAVKEGLTISTGGSNIMSVDNPPNPAAMQLFVNWLLTQEAQQVLETSTGYNSLRVDTTKEGVLPENILYEDVSYGNPCCDPKYTSQFETAWANLQALREDWLQNNP